MEPDIKTVFILLMKKLSLRGVNLSKVTMLKKGRTNVTIKQCKSALRYCSFLHEPTILLTELNGISFLSVSSSPGSL